MKNLAFLLLVLIATVTTTTAQQSPTPQIKSEEVERAVFRTDRVSVQEFDGRKQGVMGTPYIFADWLSGTITLADSQKVTIDWVYNINGETGQLVAKSTKDNELKGIFYNDIQEISIKDGTTFRLFRPVKVANETFVMCEVLFEGNTLKVYKQWGKKFVKADFVERGVYSTGRINDEYVAEFRYWADMGKKSYIELQPTTKKLPESVKNKQSLITKYLTDNKIKGKLSSEELVAIFKYLDQKEATK